MYIHARRVAWFADVCYQRITTDLSWSHGRGPFNSARISRTVSRKVWFSTLSTEVCRREINKCRARSKSGERSIQRVFAKSSSRFSSSRNWRYSDRCAFFARLSPDHEEHRTIGIRSTGRTRSVGGLRSSGARPMDTGLNWELVRACYRPAGAGTRDLLEFVWRALHRGERRPVEDLHPREKWKPVSARQSGTCFWTSAGTINFGLLRWATR